MATPLVEIFEPRHDGTQWVAAARIHFRDGVLDLAARAPEVLVARNLARLHAVFAYRKQLPDSTRADSPPGVAGTDWAALGRLLGEVMQQPAVRPLVEQLAACIPYVSPLVALGVLDPGIVDLASIVLDARKTDSATAAELVRKVTARANKGQPKATALLEAMRGTALAVRELGPAGAAHVRRLVRARALLLQASSGEQAAQDKLVEIIRRGTDDATSARAAGYIGMAIAHLVPRRPGSLVAGTGAGWWDSELVGVGAVRSALASRLRALRSWRRYATR